MLILKLCNEIMIFLRTSLTYVRLSRAVGRIWTVHFTEAIRPHGDSFIWWHSSVWHHCWRNTQSLVLTRISQRRSFCIVSHNAGTTLNRVDCMKVLYF